MSISARNQLIATVNEIQTGAVNDVIHLTLASGDKLTAVITHNSTERLGLTVGGEVVAIFKAPAVMLSVGDELILSSCNQLSGVVEKIVDGAVNSEVHVKTENGTVIVAIITAYSCQNLKLEVGSAVTASIKASNVVLGVKAKS